MKTLLLAAAFSITSTVALAGPQYVDRSGYAVSGYDVVAYFDLPQVAVGEEQAEAVPGHEDITAEYNGATFAFSTVENRDRFLTDPAKFAPQFDGHCAYGVAVGGKVPANPHLWRIVDGKLYLNITKKVVRTWEDDIDGYISTANDEWTALEDDAASEKRVPWLWSSAPVEG